MSTEPIELRSGMDMSTTDFARRRADVIFYINKGNTIYLTVNGSRRVALVPPEVGEVYERLRTDPPTVILEAEAREILAALGANPASIQLDHDEPEEAGR